MMNVLKVEKSTSSSKSTTRSSASRIADDKAITAQTAKARRIGAV